MTRFTVVVLSLITISFILAGVSHTKIDKKDIVGIWLFDEGKGDAAEDASGNGNLGEINGAKWDNGKFGKALSFNGKDNYVKIDYSSTLDITTPFTVGAWVKCQDSTGLNYQWLYTNFDDDAARYSGFSLSLEGDTAKDLKATLVIYNGGNAWRPRGTTNIVDDQWHHTVGVWDGSLMKIYVDGKLENSFAQKTPPLEAQTEQWECIGCVGDYVDAGTEEYPFLGIIDEFSIFNVALTENDIQNIMTKGLKGITAVSPKGKLATTWGDLKQQ